MAPPPEQMPLQLDAPVSKKRDETTGEDALPIPLKLLIDLYAYATFIFKSGTTVKSHCSLT